MIQITKTDSYISINGHAQYDTYGKDIVCAGVSALTFTLIESLRQLAQYDKEVVEGEGYMKINIKDLPQTAEILVKAFVIGVRWIQSSYPEYVYITEL